MLIAVNCSYSNYFFVLNQEYYLSGPLHYNLPALPSVAVNFTIRDPQAHHYTPFFLPLHHIHLIDYLLFRLYPHLGVHLPERLHH